MARVIANNAVGQSDTAKTAAGSVSVGAADVQLVAANPDRAELVICNDHATQVLYLGLGGTALANKGVRLGPGQSYVTNVFTGEVRAIASGAATVATYAEV